MSHHPDLPQPTASAALSSRHLVAAIVEAIHNHDGWLPFAQYMDMALYEPGLGYYSGGAQKFGAAGDFVTAPTLTPLFGQTLARQLQPLLAQTAGQIYEFGAGSGDLAAAILSALPAGTLQHYYIIEVSAELAERQRTRIAECAPQWTDKVVHLSALPDHLDGIILGNEVLDAMPVEVYERDGEQVWRMGVAITDGRLHWQAQPEADARTLMQVLDTFPDTHAVYRAELHPRQYALVATLAQKLTRGAMIWIDYGFDAAQYYHPQRRDGTLIGHYRHHTVHDPFFLPGLTDLSAHVNFTRIADAGMAHGLDLIGYTTQAYFLLNLGITELLSAVGVPESTDYIQAAAACHTLLDQHEMGELFKVMALGKNIDVDWLGFRVGDLCHTL